MILPRILFACDVLVALVIGTFFVVGLADGSVSAFNMELWLGLLAGTAAVLIAGWMLQARGNRAGAIAVLLILFVPALLFALFLLLAVALQPRWN
jgi:hypothetical protein